MRFINTETGYFEEFVDSTTAPLYAILSHTWNKPPEEEPEQTYQDVLKIQQRFRELQSSCSEKEPHTLSRATSSIRQAVEETGSLPGPSVPGDTEPPSEVEPARSSPTRPSIWDSDSGLSKKIREACRVASEDGYRYIWVDSSCIDKTSSSELSEAINSMFNWYRDAQICYAFLSDVPSDEDVTAKGLDLDLPSYHHRMLEERAKDSSFRKSRWFKRSWTLQELIAPRIVVFLAQDWKGLGTKHSLAEVIEEITRIDRDILTHKKAVADESVAERMRWAASREATRVEDEAYSLLGIFGITMTTVYGEGGDAFQRLQEEILQRIPDRSLFAWCNSQDEKPIQISHETNSVVNSLSTVSPFATSPRSFANQGGKISALSEQGFKRLQLPIEEYSLTPHGIRTKIRLIPMKPLAPHFQIKCADNDQPRDSLEPWYLILLGSQRTSYSGSRATNYILGKLCCITPGKSSIQLLEVPHGDGDTTLIWTDFELVTRSLIEKSIDIYLPRPKPSVIKRKPVRYKPDRPQPTTVSFSPWAPRAMPPGYTISELGRYPNQDRCLWPHDPSSLSLLLSNTESVTLCIQYRYMPYINAWLSGNIDSGAFIEARVWIVSPNSTPDGDAPYASAIWSTGKDVSTLPIQYIPVPVTQSGKFMWITLQLWLGNSRYGHYHAHVEVATGTANPTDTCNCSARSLFQDSAPLRIPEPHPDFKFTMLGSTKRALEAQGYSVHLEASDGNSGNSHSSHSYSLTISDSMSNPTFAISIKYFHDRRTPPGQKFPQFIFVARVTLESTPDQGSQKYQDGPYVLNWADGLRWSWKSAREPIYLSTPHGDVLELELALDRAWVSEYYLVVNLARHEDSNSRTGVGGRYPMELRWEQLVDPHDHINLTFPTHIRRDLQTHGYEVHFEGKDNVYRLTLSDANHAINIEYSHDLSTGSDGQQGLTFRACVTTSVLQSSQDAGVQTKCQTVNWDAWEPESRYSSRQGGWRWKLHDKVVKLALPNGLTLTLRLNLYLVWLSEYCITVGVISPKRLSQTTHESLGFSRESSHSGNDEANAIGGDAAIQETTAGEGDEKEIGESDVVASVALPTPGVEDAEVEESGANDREQAE